MMTVKIGCFGIRTKGWNDAREVEWRHTWSMKTRKGTGTPCCHRRSFQSLCRASTPKTNFHGGSDDTISLPSLLVAGLVERVNVIR